MPLVAPFRPQPFGHARVVRCLKLRSVSLFAAALALATPAFAQSGRDTLASAAFASTSRADALGKIERVLGGSPTPLETAMALGYRAQLKRARSDALAARKGFEALIARNPRDAEAQMALAGWHLQAIADLGPMMARTGLGARKASGLAALDRALAAGGNRPLLTGYASLILARVDARAYGARALKLAETASTAPAPTALDRTLQRAAKRLLPSLRVGNPAASGALAKALLPFGRIAR